MLWICLLFCLTGISTAFAPLTSSQCQNKLVVSSPQKPQSSPTALNLLLDVPDSFFTVTMIGAGLVLSFTKSFGRMRMEERAWEQRLEEGRQRRLEEDPTLTELDLRRREAEMEWSAYGKPRMEEEAIRREMEEREQELLSSRPPSSRKRVKVMEREGDDDDEDSRENRMSDREIDQFETEFGIDYDPYYDDPYTEDEMPEGKYQVDKKYGDRIYQDGEIFYKDAESGMYYRQGARPRSVNYFSP